MRGAGIAFAVTGTVGIQVWAWTMLLANTDGRHPVVFPDQIVVYGELAIITAIGLLMVWQDLSELTVPAGGDAQ